MKSHFLCFLQYAQWSAIFFAIKSGDKKTVDVLLDHEAETNLLDKVSDYSIANDCVHVYHIYSACTCSLATPLSAAPRACSYKRR